jgi:excisionase family DNA binding protein
MASRRAAHEAGAMNSTAKSISPRDGSVDLAARKFSKARSIAERLGISPRTIFRWADAGKIARYKINHRVVLFSEVEVLAYVESGGI